MNLRDRVHDPLCNYKPETENIDNLAKPMILYPCMCDYAAAVRAHEREQAAQRVEAQRSSFRARDWDDAIAAAAAAAREEE